MHEVGITQNLIEIAERNAVAQGAQKVLSMTVEIGALSGVIPEAVEFAFEACAKGPLFASASLEIRRIAGRGRCRQCGAECEMDQFSLACPACDAFALEVLQGEELRLTEMEID